ncbi:hypothetical protein COLO4_02950 [Corchorus olitorius]|uniref:Uncharacterized protein n=1 Tax=Corchorus olitorius TaxID=93759 RepID=A0A1R3KZ91_9ROSI|nr:hypothetical protein COLO4_03268 [Corchorus olitorius]OMP12620.1 hypothetical protein COLO4_02950 [Corchorus olitorius]
MGAVEGASPAGVSTVGMAEQMVDGCRLSLDDSECLSSGS